MERIHRIFANRNHYLKACLDRLQIPHEYERSIVGETVFLLIPETHAQWPELSQCLQGLDVFHTVELSFTLAEIRAAPWCELGAAGHFGYPQPDEDFGYKAITYDAEAGCMTCGIGAVQRAPFRFRKAPTQRRSQIIQLNWVFDEFFVSSDARGQLEAAGITGIDFEQPVLHRSGEPMAGWFQMRVLETAESRVKTAGLVTETCQVCGRVKFNSPAGEMLALQEPLPSSSADVVKSREWFGSGGSAQRLVLVSQRFVAVVLQHKWRGLCLSPIAV